jgi:hypothetical protein
MTVMSSYLTDIEENKFKSQYFVIATSSHESESQKGLELASPAPVLRAQLSSGERT